MTSALPNAGYPGFSRPLEQGPSMLCGTALERTPVFAPTAIPHCCSIVAASAGVDGGYRKTSASYTRGSDCGAGGGYYVHPGNPC
jgi:hypothetical protein